MPPIVAEIGAAAHNNMSAERSEKKALAFRAHRSRHEQSGFSGAGRVFFICDVHQSCQDRHPICDNGLWISQVLLWPAQTMLLLLWTRLQPVPRKGRSQRLLHFGESWE